VVLRNLVGGRDFMRFRCVLGFEMLGSHGGGRGHELRFSLQAVHHEGSRRSSDQRAYHELFDLHGPRLADESYDRVTVMLNLCCVDHLRNPVDL